MIATNVDLMYKPLRRGKEEVDTTAVKLIGVCFLFVVKSHNRMANSALQTPFCSFFMFVGKADWPSAFDLHLENIFVSDTESYLHTERFQDPVRLNTAHSLSIILRRPHMLQKHDCLHLLSVQHA